MYVGKTFDETYPKYEFSELVRLSIIVGTWLGHLRRKHSKDGQDHDGGRAEAALAA